MATPAPRPWGSGERGAQTSSGPGGDAADRGLRKVGFYNHTDRDLSLTIEGKAVKLAFTAVTPNGNLPITMTGDIDGDSIANGKAEIGGMGIMEFVAKKKQ